MITGEIKIGERYLCKDETVSHVTLVGDRIEFRDESDPGGAPYRFSPEWFRETHSPLPAPAPAPAPTQHPADLKPRTGKAPMHLIPWAVVPWECIPEALRSIAPIVLPDGDMLREGPEVPPEDKHAALPLYLFNALIEGGVSLAEVATVFEHGANKYARDNWRSFAWDKAAEDAYFAAIMRHLIADATGEVRDPESQLRHRAHAACGCLIWLWHVSPERRPL